MNNRLEQLVEYCHKTNMSYSYKPVLIMALVQHDGVITIQDAAHEFIQYYRNRLSFGLIAERSNSIYSNLNCTIEQITSNIKTNPVKALLNRDFFVYDKQHELLSFVPNIRAGLTIEYKQKIIHACLLRLDDYYARIKNQTQQDFVCFHNADKENGYLSNHYHSDFSFQGIRFTSVEQYLMYRKAILFEDSVARNRILLTDDTTAIKQIGASVKNYNKKIWNGQCQLIAYQGLMAKFTQNKILQERLFNTGSSILADCSESDRVWGIGLSIDDDRRFLVDQWQGENKLGFSLMQVRNMLQETRNL